MPKFYLSVLALLIATTVAADPGHLVQVPDFSPEGGKKDVTVLSVSDTLKVANVILRAGTTLPTHSTPVPATILILKGQGVIHVGGTKTKVKEGSLIILEAGQPHDVVPEEGSDMQLLVHYLLGADQAKNDDHGHDH